MRRLNDLGQDGWEGVGFARDDSDPVFVTGGSGRDYFVLGNEDTAYYQGTGRAVITDFSASSDYIMLNGLSSAYDFIQDGADVEIRFDGTTNLVADVFNATVAGVTAHTIFIG